MKRLIFILMALLSYGILRAETLKSPDGNIVLDFELDNGVPVYKVDYKGRPVIKESKLGLELKSGKNLTDGFVWLVLRHRLSMKHGNPFGER